MAQIVEHPQPAVQVLRNKGIILTPTDTVWGLSGDARDPEVYSKLIDLKGRNADKGIILLVHTEVWLERCVQTVPDIAWDLLEIQSGPTTLVYENASSLVAHTSPPDGSIAIRLVSQGPIYELLRLFNAPLLSTSANFSGTPTAQNFDSIPEKLKNLVDIIYRPPGTNDTTVKPSSVIKINNDGQIRILRK